MKWSLLPTLLIALACPLLADNEIPVLRPDGVLKYYGGSCDGDTPLDFRDILTYAPDRLKYLRNEIVAKYGKPFKTRELRDHFQATNWYKANPAFHDGLLTKIDTENIARVQAVENRVTNNRGLFNDLKKKRPVTCDGNVIHASFDNKTNNFVFRYKSSWRGDNELYIPSDIEKKGGYDPKEDAFLFVYQNKIYCAKGYMGGHHWSPEKNFEVIGFQYDPETAFISNILVNGEVYEGK